VMRTVQYKYKSLVGNLKIPFRILSFIKGFLDVI